MTRFLRRTGQPGCLGECGSRLNEIKPIETQRRDSAGVLDLSQCQLLRPNAVRVS